MLTSYIRYKLAARDLDSILPVSREPNHSHGGIGDVRVYNESDVQALADRLRPTFGPDEETESDGGPEIDGIQAMNQYNVSESRRVVLFYRIRYADDAQVEIQSAETHQTLQKNPPHKSED